MPGKNGGDGVIRITAAKGAGKIPDYAVRDFAEPGSVPNWFVGVILLLRDEIQEDEKIVMHGGVIRIVKKTSFDRLIDWVKKRKRAEPSGYRH